MSMLYFPTKPDEKYRCHTLASQQLYNYTFNKAISDPFSFELWVRFDEFPRVNPNMIFGVPGGSGVRLQISDPGDRYKILFHVGGLTDLCVEAERVTSWDTHLIQPISSPFHIVCTYDGSATAAGMQIYLNGVSVKHSIRSSNVPTSLLSGELVGGSATGGRMTIFLAQFHESRLTGGEVQAVSSFPVLDPSAAFNYRGSQLTQALFRPNRFKAFHYGPGMKGRLMDAGVWGGWYYHYHSIGSAGYSSVGCNSPYNHTGFWPISFFDGDHKTYLATAAWGGPGWNLESYMAVFDHDTRVMTLEGVARALPAFSTKKDYHSVPNMSINPASHLPIVFRERGHNTAIDVFSYPVADQEIPYVEKYGSNLSYNNSAYIGSRLINIARNGNINEDQVVWYSDDDGQTWQGGAAYVHLKDDYWAYPSVWVFADVMYIRIRARNQEDNIDFSSYPYQFILKTTDGINFSDYRDQFSIDSSVGQWTWTDLITYAIAGAPSPDVQRGPSTSTSDAYREADGTLVFVYTNGQLGTRELVKVAPDGSQTRTGLDPAAVVGRFFQKNDTELLLLALEARDDGANNQVVLYTTDNNFLPLDAGEVLTPRGYDYQKQTISNSITPGSPRMFYAMAERGDWTDRMMLWAYEYIPA